MNILVTNDDGIESEGILLLARWARKLGTVTIAAPKFEQSGKSHAIELHKSFEVKHLPSRDGMEFYRIDSTPADCIRYAFASISSDYDLVLSGVNKGFNLGTDILYSGTVGAVFEAECFNTRALAVSTDSKSFEASWQWFDRILDFIFKKDLFQFHGLYNINIPVDPKDILITRQGGPYYKDRFINKGDDMYLADGFSVYQGTSNLEDDLDAVMNGYISVSPLTTNRTNEDAFRKLTQK